MAEFDLEAEEKLEKKENFKKMIYNIPDFLTMKEKIEVLKKLKQSGLRN